MKKRPLVAVLNTVEAVGAQVIVDSTVGEWCIVKTSAGLEILLGQFRTGKIQRIESFDPVAERKQIVVIDAVAVPEVITANTRYRVEIGNPDDKYETHRRQPIVHAYTSAAVLSGIASTDRLNVYTALNTKINAYAGNNVTSYLLTVHDFTLGTSAGDAAANFIVGEIVTQQTSTETGRVARCTITSGTFAGDDAAGKIWVFGRSAVAPTWLDTAVTLSGAGTVAGISTNCVVTQTAATMVEDQGLAIEDDAGYFISYLGRAGLNWVGATQGFATAIAETGLAGVYSEGDGTTMAALVPVYDQSKQSVVSGFLEYELQHDGVFTAGKTYRKYVIEMLEGDEDARGATAESALTLVILYADYAAGELAALDTAIQALT